MFTFDAGELEMRLELDDISVHVSKHTDKNVCQSEKMTQTDIDLFGRLDGGGGGRDKGFTTTPNGTSPCNHPTLSCQVRIITFFHAMCTFLARKLVCSNLHPILTKNKKGKKGCILSAVRSINC